MVLSFWGLGMQRSPLLTDSAEKAVSAAENLTQPLISGPASFLWAGVAAVVVIFILALFLLMRGRARAGVRREKPPAEFFQPAGEGADISFDEEEDEAPPATMQAHGDLSSDSDADDADDIDVAADNAKNDDATPFSEPVEDNAPPKHKKAPFAGLFSRKSKSSPDDASEFDAQDQADPAEEDTGDDLGADLGEDDAVQFAAPPANDPAPAHAAPYEDDPRDLEREELKASLERELAARRAEEVERQKEAARLRAEAEQERAEELRREAEERNLALRRRAEEEEAARAAIAHHAGADVAQTLAEVEEALHVQSEEIKAETRNLLDAFASRFDARIETLANAVEKHAIIGGAGGGAGSGAGGDDESRIEALVEMISRRLADHRENINAELSALTKRIEDVATGPEDASALRREIAMLRATMGERATPVSAPQVQSQAVPTRSATRPAIGPETASASGQAVIANPVSHAGRPKPR